MSPPPITRHIAPNEFPPPGSIAFPCGTATVNRLTEYGEWQDHGGRTAHLDWIPSHVYIITGPTNATSWTVTEALAKGVITHTVPARTHDTPHILVPVDKAIADRIAAVAVEFGTKGIKYDWTAIARQAIRGIAAMFGAERPVNWVLRRTFRSNNPHRMICSEVGARAIEIATTSTPEALTPAWDVTPLDLWMFLTQT